MTSASVKFSAVPLALLFDMGSVEILGAIETVSPEGIFCDTVQVPSNGGDMELI